MYLNVGIDVAKNVHETCILTESGKQIGNFIRIKNSKSSIQKFRESVESASRELNLTPRIGMEATGIYWYSVYFELSRYYVIHLYNPSQIRRFAAVNTRGSKTDQIDAKTIARMLRFGESPKVCYGDKTRIELKEYCIFHFKLKSKLSDLKKRFVRNVHLIFPGYDQVFSSVFTKTNMIFFEYHAQRNENACRWHIFMLNIDSNPQRAPRPLDMLEMGEEKLFEQNSKSKLL